MAILSYVISGLGILFSLTLGVSCGAPCYLLSLFVSKLANDRNEATPYTNYIVMGGLAFDFIRIVIAFLKILFIFR